MKPQEFFRRWGEGIKSITPMQSIKITLIGNFIIFIGIILGLITVYYYKQWWLFVILIGTLIVQGIGFLGTIQKYLAFRKIEEITREVDS